MKLGFTVFLIGSDALLDWRHLWHPTSTGGVPFNPTYGNFFKLTLTFIHKIASTGNTQAKTLAPTEENDLGHFFPLTLHYI